LFSCNVVAGQIISTFAGNGIPSNLGDGGMATNASIDYPTRGAFDRNGNYYFALGTHGNGVRKVSTDGIIIRVAGTGVAGFGGDGGPATAALLNNAQSVAVDSFGNIYVADVFNNRIRKIDAVTGIIATCAGTGSSPFSGDGNAATSTNMQPNNLCFDHNWNLYFTDGANNRIRKIDKTGVVSTVAGNGTPGLGGDEVAATSTAINPYGIGFDQSNNLYFTDDYGRIEKLTPDGILHFFAGNGMGAITGDSGDGGPATAASMVPTYIAFNAEGTMFVAETEMNKVRAITPTGYIATVVGTGSASFSGDGGLATNATINYPGGITTDTCGNLYICDAHDYHIRRVEFNAACLPATTPNVSDIQTKIFPNPTSGRLYVSSETYVHIRLSNSLGKQILAETLNPKIGTLTLTSLPSGLYLLELTDDEGNRTVHKIIKQ